MLLNVLDGNGLPQVVYAQAQDAITDRSGNLASATVFQALMPANAQRSGWLFQNTSAHAMLLNEVTAMPIPGAVNSWVVAPGASFPPSGFPIPTGAIEVGGGPASVVADTYVAREW